MGTFVKCVMDDSLHVPEELRERYLSQMRTLFREGGMMTWHESSMFGIRLTTLDPEPRVFVARDQARRFYYSYHYYDQDYCEEVGINEQTLELFSGKIDGDLFRLVVPAAYVLQALYATGMYTYTSGSEHRSTPAAIIYICGWFHKWLYPADIVVGWLNGILGEQFCNLHCDMWRQFEVARKERLIYWNSLEKWTQIISPCFSMESCIETTTICSGLSVNPDAARPETLTDATQQILQIVGRIYQQIQEYRDTSTLSEEEQILLLTNMWNEFFRTRQIDMDIAGTDDEHLHRMREIAQSTNYPTLIMKAVAEVYDRDFWELWESVSEAGNNSRVLTNIRPVRQFPTLDFLQISPDERIYLWTADNPSVISKELEQWFHSLRRQYNRLLHENWNYDQPAYRIYKVLDDADMYYGRIYVFRSCLDESLDHINDRRYHTLWRMFERMVYSRRSLDSIDKIRIENGFSDRDHQWRDHPMRRQLRHYLALIANKELRRTVFGF